MRRLVLGSMCVAMSYGCSGREAPAVEPAPLPTSEVEPAPEPTELTEGAEPDEAAEPIEEPTAGETDLDQRFACGADADCAMATPCCACPRVAVVMTADEARRMPQRCARVRCRGCDEDAPAGPPMEARCVNGACAAMPVEGGRVACASDDECVLATPCCACADVFRAMHVREAEVSRANCARRACARCRPASGPPPTRAVCVEGVCEGR